MKACSVAVLTAICVMATAADTFRVEVQKGPIVKVTISSRGADARTVLHDLLDKAGRDYVLLDVPRTELFLSLTDTEFDEALALLCKLSKLNYEQTNGIYTFRRSAEGTRASASDQKHDAPSQAPGTGPKAEPVNHTTTTTQALEYNSKPQGKLSSSVLKAHVKGTWHKTDLRKLIQDLASQAKVTIEVDPSVPKYALDFHVNTTSLGWSLGKIAETLKLEMVFTDRQSLLLKPKKASGTVAKSESKPPSKPSGHGSGH